MIFHFTCICCKQKYFSSTGILLLHYAVLWNQNYGSIIPNLIWLGSIFALEKKFEKPL
jgi:hypothetical protein